MKFDIRDRETAKVIAVCALLAILVAIVFGQTASHEFVHYDDNFYVSDNPRVTGGLTLPAIARALTAREGGLWTPLVTISHMLDWHLYGPDAGGHHISNVLLHLASVILLFLILRRMTGALWRSAFVAAVFAIHPLHVESVAWIAERKDVLSGLFFMLTMGAYLRYVERPGSVVRYLCVVLLFALGLMSKPMLVTLPFVLLLLDYWPLNRLFRPPPADGARAKGFSVNRRAVVEKIPLLALSLGVSAIALLGSPQTASIDIVRVPFRTRLGEAPANLVIYLGQMFWPSRLAVIYTHYEASLLWWPEALAFLGALSLGFFLARRAYPYLWMGWLWNLVMLAPVSGIVQISRHARADHYNYLPQIGLYIGLTWAVADWTPRLPHRRAVLGAAAGFILAALLVVAWRQTSWWRDDMSLWTHALEVTSDNSIAHSQLGDALIARGRATEGIAELREALRIDPASAMAHNDLGIALLQQRNADQGIAELREALRISPLFAEAHCNLGKALSQAGRTEEGLAEFREGLRINPFSAEAHFSLGGVLVGLGRSGEGIDEFHEALRINPRYADAHDGLGMALLGQGRPVEGFAELREALRINPASADAHNNLGIALFRDGQAEEGIAELREASNLAPAFAEARSNLDNALIAQGRADEGIAQLREAVRLDPAYQRAHYSLGKVLLATGKTDEGISELRDASGIKPDPAVLRALAAAYAGEGKYSDAIRTAQSALQLPGTPEVAGALRKDIKLYETGRPLPGGQ